MPPTKGIRIRRNGTQQACEPCRKQKVACDHAIPHCARCIRKQRAAMCVYHPAPMTRIQPRTDTHQAPTNPPGDMDGPDRSLQGPVVTTFSSELNRVAQSPINSFRPTTVIEDQATTASETHGRPNWRDLNGERDTPTPRSVRYYGPTSFSSVFTENGLLEKNEEHTRCSSLCLFGEPLLGRDGPSSPTTRMKEIILALQNIPNFDICKSFMDEFKSQYHSLTNVVLIKHAITGLWLTFGDQLSEPRTSEKLGLIAEILFRNEEKPLPPAPDDGIEWLNTFTALNLRFEMLGMLFCFFGFAYHCLPDGDYRFRVPENCGRDRKQSSWRMKECADICIKMV